MLKSTKVLILLATVSFLGIGGYCVWFGLGIARSFDTTIRVQNDLGSDANVTLLLQNHDDGGLYLTETRSLSTAESWEEPIGFEKARCVYITTASDSFSGYVTREMVNDETRLSDHAVISLKTIFDRHDPCLREMSSYGIGLHNRINVSGKDY